MTTPHVPDWVSEFGEEYAVPDAIAQAEGIEDLSWHNDVCPSFGLHVAEGDEPYAHTVRIWCDHPDPEQSGWGTRDCPRFQVAYEADASAIAGVPCGVEWSTDDPDEAVRVLLASLEHVRAEVRNRN
jgi:hypothetical protein